MTDNNAAKPAETGAGEKKVGPIRQWIKDHPNIWEFILFNVLSNISTITRFVVTWIGTAIFITGLGLTQPFHFLIFNYDTKGNGLGGFLTFLLAEVLAPGKPTTFGVNDPIMSWVDSKGFVARTVAKTLTKREAKIRQKTGSPDLNTLFILNMPPRAMSKMTQGMVDSAMVDAIVNIANGHTFRGLSGVIAGFFRNQSANKRTAKELNHD